MNIAIPDKNEKADKGFIKVLDGRGQPIRALWRRAGIYYGQLRLPYADGIARPRFVPLKDPDGNRLVTTSQAVSARQRLRTQRANDALPVRGLRLPVALSITTTRGQRHSR